MKQKPIKEKGAYWLEHRDYKIDLSLSKNPLGCSRKVKQKVNLRTVNASKYPKEKELTEAITSHFSIPKENLVIGAGIDNFINLFPQVFLEKGDPTLMPKTTFPRFSMATKAFGGKAIFVPMKKDMRINFKSFEKEAKEIKPKIIFIANPNNPTGLSEKKSKILNLTKRTKAIVVVDEAGIDFCEDGFSLTKEPIKFKNLVVLRGFSKGYGLSGLRIGFCIAPSEIISRLQPIKLTFPVSSLAMKAAVVALSDQEHLNQTKALFKRETRFFFKNLKRIGFKVLPPESNLIFAKVPTCFSSAEELIESLHKENIHCVDGRHFGFPKFIRINPATREINKKFIKAVEEITKKKTKKLT